jgi:hypothetical protein
MRLPGPTPWSWAKFASAALNASVLTVGSSSQWVAPRVGWTKP